MAKLVKGDLAPDFTLPTDGNKQLTLSSLRGSAVVLYFYPKDDTSGCTLEAIDFTNLNNQFKDLGVTVIGVSPDSPEKHDKFICKHDLSITLVSDEDKTTLEKYGVWVEKSMYGKKYMGVERSTFLINKDGIISEAWYKVSATGHAQMVLDAAKTEL